MTSLFPRPALAVLVPVLVSQVFLSPSAAHGQAVEEKAGEAVLKEHDRLVQEAKRLRGEGKTTEAIAAGEASLAIMRKFVPADEPDLAVALGWLAELHVEREAFAAAIAARREARDILRKRLGDFDWRVGDARRVLKDVERLAGMDKEQRVHLAEATRLNRMAVKLHGAGKYAEAAAAARQALGIRRQVLGERHPDTAHSLNNLAEPLRAQGDYAGARPLYEQALAICKQVLGERHPDTATTLNNLAELLRAQGDYAGARPLYQQALTICKQVLGERHPDTANSLNNLALLLKAQGDYAGARPLYEQALAINKQVLGERHPDTANSLNNLAELLDSQGDDAGARPLYEQALAINKQVLGERHPNTAYSLNNLAALLHSQGDDAGARPLYEQALAICKQVLGERHPHTASSLNNLAFLLDSQGDYAGARPLYEQVLAIRKQVLGERHPDTAQSLNDLAFLLDSQGDYAGARPLYEQALDITRGSLEQAADSQSERQQLAMSRTLRYQLDSYLSLTARAEAAASAYREVLAWKGAVLARQRRLRSLVRLARQANDPEIPRLLEQRQQVAALLAVQALATPDPGQAEAWRKQVDHLTEKKDRLEGELARHSAVYRRQRDQERRGPEQIAAVMPRQAALVDVLEYWHSTPPGPGQTKWQWERRVVAFVVRPGRPIARVELGPAAVIERQVDAWRIAIKADRGVTPNAAAGDDPAAVLRRLVWEPLEPHLAEVQTLLISPDGALGRIPLGALPAKKRGSYLIEQYAITVVPVPQMLGASRAEAESGEVSPASILLVGNVDYGGDAGEADKRGRSRAAASGRDGEHWARFGALPSTREEILAVSDSFTRQYRGGRVESLRETEATEAAVRAQAPTCRWLHLATHGYFAPEALKSALAEPAAGPGNGPLRLDLDRGAGHRDITGWNPGLLSGLALAGANVRPTPPGQDDGILTALEVAELDLSGVELATLAACETGLGDVAGGEGLLGLQRAFQVAGARAVVASLWKVDDTPTQKLMSRFYENLWRRKMTAAGALREAQLYMLREGLKRGLVDLDAQPGPGPKHVPPYYWAAFVLSGDVD
jgi:CHAT domain-containing protein/tetratricopeptide (TPR) repeat protein